MIVRALVLAAALCAICAPVGAQTRRSTETDGIAATVTIVDPPLNLEGTRSLRFGSITPGTGAVTILPTAPNAGEGRGNGATGYRSLTFRFTLPAALTGPGGATIPLNFNGPYAASCEITNANTCDARSRQTWNPVTQPSHTDTPYNTGGGGRFLYTRYSVYIGGQALPSATQRAGTYTGAIGVVVILN